LVVADCRRLWVAVAYVWSPAVLQTGCGGRLHLRMWDFGLCRGTARGAQDRFMQGEQRSRSLAQRCEDILALIDSVLGEHTIGAANTPPQRSRYAGGEEVAHVAS
jgi:hypothetical protein